MSDLGVTKRCKKELNIQVENSPTVQEICKSLDRHVGYGVQVVELNPKGFPQLLFVFRF